MPRKYQGLFILNTTGKEESSKQIIESLEKEIQFFGGTTNKVERLDKRPFARIAHHVDSGYYVNIGFEMEPEKLMLFRDKLKMNQDVFRVMFLHTKNFKVPSTRVSPVTK